MSSRVFQHTLTRLRVAEVEDTRGNKVRRWADAASQPMPGWAVDVGDTTEDRAGREGTTVSYTARKLGLEVDVTSADRLVLFGETFEVAGGVLRQPGPSRRTSHTIVRLTRATG